MPTKHIYLKPTIFPHTLIIEDNLSAASNFNLIDHTDPTSLIHTWESEEIITKEYQFKN